MLLVAASLSLLVIYSGLKLYAKSNTQNLGNLFKYFSYFIVLMGFVILFCVGAKGIIHAYDTIKNGAHKSGKSRSCMNGNMEGNCMMSKMHQNQSGSMMNCGRFDENEGEMENSMWKKHHEVKMEKRDSLIRK